MSRSSSFFGASAGGAGATLPVVSIPRPAGHGTGDFSAPAGRCRYGTVAKLAMRQPFVLFKGLTFQKLCLP
ncbi:hypothetical protein AIZ04_23610, partial [Salmonella enterica subsp. enterica serovar Typhimurium]